MPVYEYVCHECSHKFELLRPLSRAAEPADCPKCHRKSERVLSTFCCFSANDQGEMAPVTGSSCSTCGSANCGSCGI